MIGLNKRFTICVAGFVSAALFCGLVEAQNEAACPVGAQNEADRSMESPLRVRVEEARVPVLLDRSDNVLFYVRIDAPRGGVFEGVNLELNEGSAEYIDEVKLYYSGTDASKAPDDRMQASRYIPGGARSANPSYSILKASCGEFDSGDSIGEGGVYEVSLASNFDLYEGINYLWVSVDMKDDTPLMHKFFASLTSVNIDGQAIEPEVSDTAAFAHRMGVGVRYAGDDGAATYRIPGLVTSMQGSLIAVYDIRQNSATDLQADIRIGVSRSTDGGRTWEPMRVAMNFENYGGLPAAQNGVGDPSVLVDPSNGRIWVVASWCHGMGENRAWTTSAAGLSESVTGQLVMAYSDDDGLSWSEPINITEQVKRPEWNYLLQGPGRGIALGDGTLVFPIQYIDAERVPYAGLMYSKDHGRTWCIHNGARSNTTESQVAQLSTGELMLNMRDNRKGSRAVSTTSDLGRTWTEHPSSRSALREPVCMASLIAADKILLFSNPDNTTARRDITIKLSFDDGLTWPSGHQLLLDAEPGGQGYSCLTMIDPATVGILYESSQANLVFQAIPLRDLL